MKKQLSLHTDLFENWFITYLDSLTKLVIVHYLIQRSSSFKCNMSLVMINIYFVHADEAFLISCNLGLR